MEELREECGKRGIEVKFGQSPIEVKRVNYCHRIKDDTHDKVYGVNMQMCDLGKRLSDPLDPPSEEAMKGACDVLERHLKMFRELNRASKLPIEITEEHIKIINRFMEEKKTKKMTKAEAFEYLKGKKVNAKDKDRVVQMKMFDCGIKWRCGECEYYNFGSYLFIDNDGFLSHCGNDEEYWKRHAYEEISADDILSLEIVEEKSEEEDALDLISTVGARLSEVLRRMEGHKHIVITEDDVILYDEGMSLFHSDPF